MSEINNNTPEQINETGQTGPSPDKKENNEHKEILINTPRQCGICYELQDHLMETPCHHTFCRNCLIAQHGTRNRKCAFCRALLPLAFRNTYVTITEDEDIQQDMDEDPDNDYNDENEEEDDDYDEEDEEMDDDEDYDETDFVGRDQPGPLYSSPRLSKSKYTLEKWNLEVQYLSDFMADLAFIIHRQGENSYYILARNWSLEIYMKICASHRKCYAEFMDTDMCERLMWDVPNLDTVQNVKIMETYQVNTQHQIEININGNLNFIKELNPVRLRTNSSNNSNSSGTSNHQTNNTNNSNNTVTIILPNGTLSSTSQAMDAQIFTVPRIGDP